MTREEVRSRLAEIGYENSNLPVTEENWAEMKARFRCDFPQCFVYYIEEQKSYSLYGCHLRPVGEDLIHIAAQWEKDISPENWDDDLIPFYDVGNGDLICLRASEGESSRVYYWNHEDFSITQAEESFENWLLNPEWHE